MKTIKAREQNLFNAIDTLTQFYEEIESFLDILFSNMERGGYAAKSERLRSGTLTTKNLSRRILANATVIYIKGIEDAEDEEEIDDEDNEVDTKRAGKRDVAITNSLCIPFVQISLFPSRTIPSVRTLSSPTLLMGVLGKMLFLEKNTNKRAKPESPAMSINNLVNIQIASTKKRGDTVRLNCWSPRRMKKYKLEAKLVGFESRRLLEIDSQEKIKEVADKLIKLCKK